MPAAFAERDRARPRTGRPPTTPSRSKRLGMIETWSSTRVLLALTLGGGSRGCRRPGRVSLPPARCAHGTCCCCCASRFIRRLIALPFTVYRTFRIEERFGFNRMTLRAVARRSREGHRGRRGARRCRSLLARAVADARRRARTGGSTRGLAWIGVPAARARALPDGDRAAVQPLLAAAGRRGARAHRAAARALRLRASRAVRDGRLASARRTATRISPASARAKRIVFFDTLLTRLARRRDRGGARARARPLQAAPHPSAWPRDGAFTLALLLARGARLLAPPGSTRASASRRAARCRRRARASSCSRCRCSRSSCRRSSACYSRRARVRGRRVRRAARDGRDWRSALVKLYEDNAVDAHARSAAFAVLRFASAGGDAHRRLEAAAEPIGHERSRGEEMQALRGRRRAFTRRAGRADAEGPAGLGARAARSRRPIRSRTTTRRWRS